MVLNSILLFTRLATITRRECDVEKYFDFELILHLVSLFKDKLMRKLDKAWLCNIFLQLKFCVSQANQTVYVCQTEVHYYIKCLVKKGMKFSKITDEYIKYVRKNYGSVIFIFQGYDTTTSVKSHTR